MDNFQRPERIARPDGGGFDREAFRAQRDAARAQAGVEVREQRTGPVGPAGGPAGGPPVDRDGMRAQRDAARAQANGGFRPEPSPAPVPGWQNYRRDDRRDIRPDRREDGRDFRAERRDDRRDWNRDPRRDDWNRRDWNRGNDWNRGDAWNRGNDWNRAQRWNREWRNDRRYDWQGWRGSNRSAYRLPRYYPPRGYNYGYQRFGVGITLGSILFQQNYWINDPWDYRLPPAYGPYRWVRYYNDAMLVDIDTGEVVDVIYDIFW